MAWMCLFVTVCVQGADAELLDQAAATAARDGAPLRIAVVKPRRGEPELTIPDASGWHRSG